VEAGITSQLADRLRDAALLRGTFTLRSGRTSNVYFDKYRATCNPALLDEIGNGLAALFREHTADAQLIVAPELGAVPLAAALALQLQIPFAIVRGAQKTYGSAQQIEGAPIEQGTRAVLIEDVVTSGGAALEALELARAAGATIDTCFCLLDRNEGGAASLAAHDVTLVPLVTMRDLLGE
jgi:orotate phosphoribosyltransferase